MARLGNGNPRTRLALSAAVVLCLFVVPIAAAGAPGAALADGAVDHSTGGMHAVHPEGKTWVQFTASGDGGLFQLREVDTDGKLLQRLLGEVTCYSDDEQGVVRFSGEITKLVTGGQDPGGGMFFVAELYQAPDSQPGDGIPIENTDLRYSRAEQDYHETEDCGQLGGAVKGAYDWQGSAQVH
jgi:hypothetical protein